MKKKEGAKEGLKNFENESIKDIISDLKGLHKYAPKYIFLTETSAIPAGFAIREAWKKAYPNESPPKFYRIDPRQLKDIHNKSNKFDEKLKPKRKELEEFFKKRIKDRDAKIFVYDEYSDSGASPRKVVDFLLEPEEYGLNKDIKCKEVKMVYPVHGGDDEHSLYIGVIRKNLQYCFSEIHGKDNKNGINSNITEKNRAYMGEEDAPHKNYNFRGRIIKGEDSKKALDYYKSLGEIAGEELYKDIKKKNLENIISLICGVLGIGLILSSGLSVTGFVVGDIIHPFNVFSLIGLILLCIPILMLLKRQDTLQEILEQKEIESPSPSLKSISPQTKKEKKHFDKRSLKKYGFFGDWKVKKMESLENNLDDSSFRENGSLSFKGGGDFAKLYKGEMKSLRSKISDSKKNILESISKYDFKKASNYREDFEKRLDKLKRISDESGVATINKKIIEKAKSSKKIRKKALSAYGEIKKELDDYLVSNDTPVSLSGIQQYVIKIDDARNFLSIKNAKELSFEDLERKYLKKTKTVGLADVIKKNPGIEFVHSIPNVKYFQIETNPIMKDKLKNHQGKFSDLPLDFFFNLLKEKPPLSVSSVSRNSKSSQFYHPIGVLLEDGKIYDATSREMVSYTDVNIKNLKIRGNGGWGADSLPIKKRIDKALQGKRESYNEFIIGGGESQKVKGLYFLGEHSSYTLNDTKSNKIPTSALAELSAYALENRTTLYRFSTGKGFEEVDPRDYLKKTVKASKKKIKNKK